MIKYFQATRDFHDSLDITEKVALTLTLPAALIPAQLEITNATSCATIVLQSGYFESYLKDVIKELIEKINGLRKPILEIPNKVIRQHYSGGVDALSWACKLDKKHGTTSYSKDLSKKLCSLDQAAYQLAWESFANTKSNPNSLTVSNLLSGVDISSAWDEIHKINTSKRLDSFLNSFIEKRNICAHTGKHQSPPTGVELLDYSNDFKSLASCIDSLAYNKLISL
ncbi:MAG: HEPN domain-containing protein [Spirochaetales bacterium]|jgi:hypothetical protein|nr:HEPN domain-containing protein [Spirochaetales bacterium]